MCGSGRTGTFLACEEENVTPDILTLAKGLGGGYQPIAAVMCTANVYDTIVNGSGGFVHGHTYPGAGTIDGVSGDHVLLAPPYNLDAETIDLIVDRLGLAVDTALARQG